MIKAWTERLYAIFSGLAVLAEVLVISSFFWEAPDEEWLRAVFLAASAGFLNFTRVLVAFHVLFARLPEWLPLGYQIVLSLTVLAIIAWGMKHGWRTKILIMILLTAPSALLLF